MKSNLCPPACRSMAIASLFSHHHDLALSERLQKSGQVGRLFVAQLNSDRGWFAFNSNVQEHLNIAPCIPRVEIFYIGKNVWLNAIDLHCHSGVPSC
jgi:hypothetical protein